MAVAADDAEIIIHDPIRNEVSVQTDWENSVKIKPYKTIYDQLLSKNSPIIIESNRWKGMLNVCFDYINNQSVVFASVYLGDGFHVNQMNQFDQVRECLPPPMVQPPADLNELPDPNYEIEKECKERIIDMERKDLAKAEAKRKEEEERRKQEEYERRLQEGGEEAKGEEAEENDEGEADQ